VSALAFSPDGVLLAAGDTEGTIHLWGLAIGKEVRQLQGHRGGVESLAFSHDGKRLASGGRDTTALIWDIREVAEAAHPRPIDVSQQRLEHLWADLGGNDGARAHRAIWELAAARQTMPWLREHLKPVLPADARRMARLIADLDSDDFTVRERATRDLEALGQPAGPALRKALASKPSLEMRRRIEPIVEKLDNWPTSSGTSLREWRALEVLEHLGTPEARKLLERLAEGVAEAGLTREAKAALQRLAARHAPKP
ncbi:MAG: WD40 repeat domain-containing protein, partial [Gemmataceae bacterium]